MLLYVGILCFLVPLAIALQRRGHTKRMEQRRRELLRRRIEEKERTAQGKPPGEHSDDAAATDYDPPERS